MVAAASLLEIEVELLMATAASSSLLPEELVENVLVGEVPSVAAARVLALGLSLDALLAVSSSSKSTLWQT